ncbi:MAG: ACT domain-containing protein [Chloroflexota bacterium]|nr:ACT domain-containing protein [Chloroflexota bacterium]
MTKIKIGGIIQNDNLAEVGVLGIPDRPGTAAAILGALGKAGINVQFIVQCIDTSNQDHVVFCVHEDDLKATLEITGDIKDHICAECVTSRPQVAIISIFGPDFRERPAIAGTMFEALSAHEINILAISTSISTVSCVIDSEHLLDAVAAMKETFDLP